MGKGFQFEVSAEGSVGAGVAFVLGLAVGFRRGLGDGVGRSFSSDEGCSVSLSNFQSLACSSDKSTERCSSIGGTVLSPYFGGGSSEQFPLKVAIFCQVHLPVLDR